MANVDTPMGLRPIRHISGAPYNGMVEHFTTDDGTAIFIGDPVILSGTSQTYNGESYRDVNQAATGDVIIGVVVGVEPVTADSLRHRAASTLRLLYVATSPDLVFEIQEVSGGTALTADAAGFNADFVVGTGNATTGMSGVELNNSGEATTNTLDLKILSPVKRPGNAVGEHCKWEVMINRHQYANQVAGI